MCLAHTETHRPERGLFERDHAVNGVFARARCTEIERIGFGARARPWRVNEGDALRNQTPHTGILGCGHQIARSVMRRRSLILRHARCEREISALVYDHLRRGGLDNTRERIRIEHIGNDWLGAEGMQSVGLVSRASVCRRWYVLRSAAAA
jgi:hypothetical protein